MARERLVRDMMGSIWNVPGRWFHSHRSMPSQLTAHHEAAHAVAAVAMGIGLDRISVVGDCDTLGRVVLLQGWPHRRRGFDPHDPEHRRVTEDWIILALVGEYADAYHDGRHPDRNSPGALWDVRRAEDLAEWLFDRVGEPRTSLRGCTIGRKSLSPIRCGGVRSRRLPCNSFDATNWTGDRSSRSWTRSRDRHRGSPQGERLMAETRVAVKPGSDPDHLAPSLGQGIGRRAMWATSSRRAGSASDMALRRRRESAFSSAFGTPRKG